MKRAIKSIALFSIGILTTWLIFWYGVGNTTGFSFTNIFKKIFLTPDWQTASKATIVLDGQSGKVGIGTMNPKANVELRSKNHTLLKIVAPSSRDSTIQLYNDKYKWWAIGRDRNTQNLFVNFDNSDSRMAKNVMTITPSGNVGLWTNRPTERLDVNGSVKVETDIKLKWWLRLTEPWLPDASIEYNKDWKMVLAAKAGKYRWIETNINNGITEFHGDYVKIDKVLRVNKICDINGRNCRDIKSLGSNSNQIVSVCNISNVGKINKNGQVCKCYPKYIRVTNDSHCINAKKDGKNWYSNWTKYKCANWYIYKRKRRWFWHYRSRQKYVGFKNIFKNYNCWFDKFLNINVIGKIWTNGFSATSWYPKGWWWGIHTWDVYAEWTVWVGSRWQVAASMDRYGTIKGKRLCLNGKCITSVCFYINDYKLYKSFGAVNGNKSLTLPSVSSVKVEFFSDDLKGNVKFFDRYGNLIKTVNCWRWRDWDDALQYCRAEVSWVKYIKRNMRDEWWRSPVGLKVYTRQQICLR